MYSSNLNESLMMNKRLQFNRSASCLFWWVDWMCETKLYWMGAYETNGGTPMQRFSMWTRSTLFAFHFHSVVIIIMYIFSYSLEIGILTISFMLFSLIRSLCHIVDGMITVYINTRIKYEQMKSDKSSLKESIDLPMN